MHVLMTRGGLLRRLGDDAPLLMLVRPRFERPLAWALRGKCGV